MFEADKVNIADLWLTIFNYPNLIRYILSRIDLDNDGY
jgi:hypothetical protein